jgi:hypothetical protein
VKEALLQYTQHAQPQRKHHQISEEKGEKRSQKAILPAAPQASGFWHSQRKSVADSYKTKYCKSAAEAGSARPLLTNNALVTTSWSQEGQVGNQETPHNTEGLPLFSRGAVRASWSPLS